MTIRDGNLAQISLVDNKAEELLFKETHRRVDDLESEINEIGPSLAFLNRRNVDLAMGEASAEVEILQAKDYVSNPKAHSKREPTIGSNLTGL